MKKINDFFDEMSTFEIIVSVTILGVMLGCFAFTVKLEIFISIINTILLFITLVTTWRIYKDEHRYNLKIGFNITNIFSSDDGKITRYRIDSKNKRIGVWAANSGKVPGSFYFVGVCKPLKDSEYKLLETNNDSPNTFDPVIYQLKDLDKGLSEDIDFEKLEPGCVSKTVYFNISEIRSHFKNYNDVIMFDVVFADPFGHFYHRTLKDGLTDIKKTATQNE